MSKSFGNQLRFFRHILKVGIFHEVHTWRNERTHSQLSGYFRNHARSKIRYNYKTLTVRMFTVNRTGLAAVKECTPALRFRFRALRSRAKTTVILRAE